MTKKLLPLLLALVFAFSGCLGVFDAEADLDDQDTDQDDDGDGKDGDGNNDGTNGGGDGNETTNEAPTASLRANVTTGPAPLPVEFNLDGSDPDDDDLSWTLDLGDGSDLVEGDDLPASFDHTFTDAGNFTVAFTVSDGDHETKEEVTVSLEDLTFDEGLHRFFFRGDGLIDASDPVPNGLGISGSLALEAGTEPKAVLTGGPLAAFTADEPLVTFTSEELDGAFTISPGVEEITDRNDEPWTVEQHASIHVCTRGNANGVFSAWVYEVDGDEETLILENAGLEFTGTGLLEEDECATHRLSFAESVETHTFDAGSKIKIVLSPDVFLGSFATELLYDGDEEPNDSSLDFTGYFS